MSLDDRMREWLKWRLGGCVGVLNVPMTSNTSRRVAVAPTASGSDWRALLPQVNPVPPALPSAAGTPLVRRLHPPSLSPGHRVLNLPAGCVRSRPSPR